MSAVDVAVVRALFAAFRERDPDVAAACVHPEVEIRPALVGGSGAKERHQPRPTDGLGSRDARWASASIPQFRHPGSGPLEAVGLRE